VFRRGCIIDTNAKAELEKEIKMANKETAEAIQAIAAAIEDHGYQYGNPNNDFGMSIGDELHDIAYQFSRIADALEKIANK
jgi:hypothetical protein